MMDTNLMTGRHVRVLRLGVLLTSSTAPAVHRVNDSMQWASVLLVKASFARGFIHSAPAELGLAQ